MNDNVINGDRLRFVLSAGRTGTAFLREYIKRNFPQVEMAYEPATSRPGYMIWNMEQARLFPAGIGEKLIISRRIRDSVQVMPDKTRIEINSFLCPFSLAILNNTRELHVVHMVRHPFTWIKSMANFRAAYWRKYVIDYAPFTRARHPAKRKDWHKLSIIERYAWIWLFFNEELCRLNSPGVDYQLVRYEDLVSSNEDLRRSSAEKIFGTIIPGYTGLQEDIPWSNRINPSHDNKVSDWKYWDKSILANVTSLCAPIMKQFDYSADET